jgi:hypothetical protein
MKADYGYENAQDAGLDIKKKDWDQMWVKFGVSFDRYFTEKFYTRLTGKVDFPIKTNDWKNRGDNIKNLFGTAISGVKAKHTGIGVEFALALGYRIK